MPKRFRKEVWFGSRPSICQIFLHRPKACKLPYCPLRLKKPEKNLATSREVYLSWFSVLIATNCRSNKKFSSIQSSASRARALVNMRKRLTLL